MTIAPAASTANNNKHTASSVSHHTCPYAAALSDDEDASFQDNKSTTEESASSSSSPPSHQKQTAQLIFNEARLKCPAFSSTSSSNSNNDNTKKKNVVIKCPFRECDINNNPESLREVMMKVPPSHFPSNNKALGHVISGGGGGSSSASSSNNATPFQLAMEHVHTISAMLEHTNSTHTGDEKHSTTTAMQPIITMNLITIIVTIRRSRNVIVL